jgi:hypothetical protein
MGATTSSLSFDTGIKMPRRNRSKSYRRPHSHKRSHSHRRTHSRRHTKKNPFPNMPAFPNTPAFPKPPPFPSMPFPNMPGHKKCSKSCHHHHTHRRSHHCGIFPQGNWINTAKDYYVINNILYAKLKTKSGNYIHAQTVFSPNQRFQNKDGHFSLLLY